ncbi:MAG TPA: hypothetical protein VKE94_06885, partial [Gemmataceae bacterium]|nr:hypothetical protein [Gemmataceae bacterium]
LPWLAGIAVGLKASAVVWIVRGLRRRRLLRDRTLVTIGTCWLICFVCLLGLLLWLVPARLAPWYLLALGAALILPLARPAAAPLALAWNRHR